jgi:hypothetical protein
MECSEVKVKSGNGKFYLWIRKYITLLFVYLDFAISFA